LPNPRLPNPRNPPFELKRELPNKFVFDPKRPPENDPKVE
jgi:hypothetical protein